MTSRSPLPPVPQPLPAQSGFSLIELMIALVLGLVVIGGATAVFLSNKQSYRSNLALGQIQENSRIAFEMMSRDIRQAGLTGCGNLGRVANILSNGPTSATPAWYADFAVNAIRGFDGNATDVAVATGTGSAQRIAGTDSLMLIGVGESGASLAAHSLSTSQLTIHEPNAGLEAGDLIVACDPDHAAIAQITGLAGTVLTLAEDTGTPGNCSVGLGFPSTCSGANDYQFAVNSQLSKLMAADWFIGNNPQGSRSLYRMTLVNSAGIPTPTAQEMVRNVTDMQIQYHVPGSASFQDAGALAAAAWQSVDAVRVTLSFRSSDRYAGTDGAPITRQMTASVTLRNRTN